MTRIRTFLAALVAMPLIVMALATGPASATAPSAKVTIANQALLLPDGSAVITVTYTCAPGPGNNTVGVINSALNQGPVSGSGTVPATCDNRSQTVNIDESPGPYSPGTGTAAVVVSNSDASSFAATSRGVMIVLK